MTKPDAYSTMYALPPEVHSTVSTIVRLLTQARPSKMQTSKKPSPKRRNNHADNRLNKRRFKLLPLLLSDSPCRTPDIDRALLGGRSHSAGSSLGNADAYVAYAAKARSMEQWQS